MSLRSHFGIQHSAPVVCAETNPAALPAARGSGAMAADPASAAVTVGDLAEVMRRMEAAVSGMVGDLGQRTSDALNRNEQRMNDALSQMSVALAQLAAAQAEMIQQQQLAATTLSQQQATVQHMGAAAQQSAVAIQHQQQAVQQLAVAAQQQAAAPPALQPADPANQGPPGSASPPMSSAPPVPAATANSPGFADVITPPRPERVGVFGRVPGWPRPLPIINVVDPGGRSGDVVRRPPRRSGRR